MAKKARKTAARRKSARKSTIKNVLGLAGAVGRSFEKLEAVTIIATGNIGVVVGKASYLSPRPTEYLVRFTDMAGANDSHWYREADLTTA